MPGLADPAELVTGGGELARWSPFGAYLEGGDPAAVTAVGEGRAAVQDEASQLAALALARADGDRPGQPLARHVRRARREGAAPRRAWRRAAAPAWSPPTSACTGPGWPASRPPATGAAAAVAADGTVPPWRAGTFDRVLADVPCSGLGALRRRPEARWRKSPEDVASLGFLQRRLLAAALDAVRPGGVVCYVTCSPHLAETRTVVADVLRERADVVVLDAPAVLPEVPGLRCPAPDSKYAQFWPHRHGTDAIFLALLQRRG